MIFKKFISGINFFFVKVLLSMFLAYIIPVFNVLIMYLLQDNLIGNLMWKMNTIDILIATNACYIASLSAYFKINEKYNPIVGYIKTIGLILSCVAFTLSTYELTKNNYTINAYFYYIAVVVTSFICIVLTCFTKVEDRDINKRLEKVELEKAKDIIKKSNENSHFEIDGVKFDV